MADEKGVFVAGFLTGGRTSNCRVCNEVNQISTEIFG